MPEVQKDSVRIDYVNERGYPPVVGFDFGDFAIVLTYDSHEGGQFTVYMGSGYNDYPERLERELRWFPQKSANFTFNLSVETIQKIRKTFRRHHRVSYGKLFHLLERCVPRDILPIFFKD